MAPRNRSLSPMVHEIIFPQLPFETFAEFNWRREHGGRLVLNARAQRAYNIALARRVFEPPGGRDIPRPTAHIPRPPARQPQGPQTPPRDVPAPLQPTQPIGVRVLNRQEPARIPRHTVYIDDVVSHN
jgi:hypothetical protein